MSERTKDEENLKKGTENENVNAIEKNMLKKGYINIHHLISLLIIMVIIIVLLVSFIFRTSEYAGAMLSFAATLSSILLAVIAIIITLIDVSGQKQNVYDMKRVVYDCMLEGISYRAISKHLGVSRNTVRELKEEIIDTIYQEVQKGQKGHFGQLLKIKNF